MLLGPGILYIHPCKEQTNPKSSTHSQFIAIAGPPLLMSTLRIPDESAAPALGNSKKLLHNLDDMLLDSNMLWQKIKRDHLYPSSFFMGITEYCLEQATF